MQEIPILVLDTEKQPHELKIQYVSAGSIGQVMNGESGYHIYHVQMLTEHLLRELSDTKPELALSEEDIKIVSVAASLHDIGKAQIPQSILNHPGTLSPVEYDIVKKHALFGEEMILEADPGAVDGKIVACAAEIARCHHERVDGTGYPAGLRGKTFPFLRRWWRWRMLTMH